MAEKLILSAGAFNADIIHQVSLSHSERETVSFQLPSLVLLCCGLALQMKNERVVER